MQYTIKQNKHCDYPDTQEYLPECTSLLSPLIETYTSKRESQVKE